MGISDIDFTFIRTFIRDRAGIALESGKEYLVQARLSPVLTSEGFTELSELVAALRVGPSSPLTQKVVDALTTNETSFFRDVEPFEALRTRVFPELIAARQKEKRLNIWYAACSTGQEPYSVAMLLAEHFPELASWHVSHLATDISTDALNKAREGRYGQFEMNRGLPVRFLVKYFDKSGLDWVLKDSIRTAVQFREFNLNKTWPPVSTMDVVLLRNVMIYFDVEDKRHILGNIGRILHPEGYLFLGAAETTMTLDDQFERVKHDRAGCYRNSARYERAG
jgi:chemotaxis protein methyltransferase CheR